MENQSAIIFLNEEGNVAPPILLIRLSIARERPSPGAAWSRERERERAAQGAAPRSSLLSSPRLDITRLTEGRLHHQVTARSYLFAYKPVTINDHWSDVSRGTLAANRGHF